MSTEHQRYSLDNQSAGIAGYAKSRGYEVVQTYRDAGRSGLTLKGRAGLKQLLSDVMGGKAPYETILVLDVSRWGRFQDVDQSAHYEFLCREAGVSVVYCAEAFENDGSAASSIVKQIKRVMAAEYSRELSRKVSRAQRHQARLGFKMGGEPAFGIRRQVVDEAGHPRMILTSGERKAITTDRVVCTPGPEEEVAAVRQIFEMFVHKKMRLGDIAESIAKAGHAFPNGNGKWSAGNVRYLLENEIYIGKYVFGRKLNNLGKPFKTLPDTWSRSEMMEPIIPLKLFKSAQRRLSETTRLHLTDHELHERLSALAKEHGYLSNSLVRDCPQLPLPNTLRNRYGSVKAAFASVGFEPPNKFKISPDGLHYTEDMLLDILRRINDNNGYVSGPLIDRDPDAPPAKYYIRRFGGLIAAAERAGLSNNRENQIAARNESRKRSGFIRKSTIQRNVDKSPITNDQLVSTLKRLLSEHGYLSAALIDSQVGIPTSTFFQRHLGGLKAAYAMAGYFGDQRSIVEAAMIRLGKNVGFTVCSDREA